MVGFSSTNSFKTNTITGYSSYKKELLDKALAMIVVPLFNDDNESLELFIQTNGATNKRHTISSTLTKGDAYIALCKNEKKKSLMKFSKLWDSLWCSQINACRTISS